MGPLASMFGQIKHSNDEDYKKHGKGHDRAMFNSRLSKLGGQFPTGRMPDDDGGPIVLGDRMARANPYMNPMLDNSAPLMDRTTFDRTPSFRDPQQAGPEPPVDPRILARLFGGQ